MRNRCRGLFFAAIAALVFSPRLLAQNAPSPATSGTSDDQKFDPRDLNGTWIGAPPKPGFRNFASFDQKLPEPPLTEWAKQHLLYKSISHDPLQGTLYPDKVGPGHDCPSTRDPCFAIDLYGVKGNDPDGEYPARDCEPLSSPAIYDYPNLGSMELVTTPDGTRIHQMFAYHREWRTWWLNREHPKNLDPTYEGDSTAHWEGNTLVVDTVGYNGRTMLTQNVGHRKSDAFHLVERFTRSDYNHLEIDMTYYDPKAWGDKSWPGFKKIYRRTTPEDFEEFICSPREYMEYNSRVTSRVAGTTK